MKLIDIGANLTDKIFRGISRGKRLFPDDFGSMKERAWNNGLEKILITAGRKKDVVQALTLCQSEDRFFTTVGVHPTRAGEFTDNSEAYLSDLRKLILENRSKVVAIGECGLGKFLLLTMFQSPHSIFFSLGISQILYYLHLVDYDRLHFCAKDVQLKHFPLHFQLSEEFGLPLFLHDRNTRGDMIKLLRENRSRFKHGVIHSFTGSEEELSAYLDLGLYIGINGCSLKDESNLKVVQQIPNDRLMFETDAPYCGIRQTHAGFKHVRTHFPTKIEKKFAEGCCVKNRCEPCHIRQVVEVVAAVKGMDINELARMAFQNTMTVFFPSEVLGSDTTAVVH